jgi:hypothetical protein
MPGANVSVVVRATLLKPKLVSMGCNAGSAAASTVDEKSSVGAEISNEISAKVSRVESSRLRFFPEFLLLFLFNLISAR